MKLSEFRSGHVVTLSVTLALLAGCRSGSGFGPPAETERSENSSSVSHSTAGETVIFSFTGTDGESPTSGLTLLNASSPSPLNAHSGPFYGTTAMGGSANVGTVYRITAGGAQRVLHDFKGGKHSFSPVAQLTPLDGELYGTAYGNHPCKAHNVGSCGAVFAINKSGREHLVYAFRGGSDGAQPVGALTVLKGALYGTTSHGGKYGQGTVFSVTTSGSEKVIRSFVKPDGLAPTGSLINVNGKLYGTTSSGGAHSLGTIFSVTASGKEVVLHNFSGPPDGANPAGGLTEVNGTLYGTTVNGGGGSSNYCFLERGYMGCGTVFSIGTSGSEAVIYRFTGPPDGAFPYASLNYVNGMLYGSTRGGGAVICRIGHYCGTIFSVDISGNETVVHGFTGPPDGAYPYSSLVDVNNTLFGTTEGGGSGGCGYPYGCGTVFSITLSETH